jgi:hypothetical protein
MEGTGNSENNNIRSEMKDQYISFKEKILIWK